MPEAVSPAMTLVKVLQFANDACRMQSSSLGRALHSCSCDGRHERQIWRTSDQASDYVHWGSCCVTEAYFAPLLVRWGDCRPRSQARPAQMAWRGQQSAGMG